MSGHEVNGRVVLLLGTWEVVFRGGLVLGRVNALDAKQAVKRAANKWLASPADLFAREMLPTVYATVKDESNGQEVVNG